MPMLKSNSFIGEIEKQAIRIKKVTQALEAPVGINGNV